MMSIVYPAIKTGIHKRPTGRSTIPSILPHQFGLYSNPARGPYVSIEIGKIIVGKFIVQCLVKSCQLKPPGEILELRSQLKVISMFGVEVFIQRIAQGKPLIGCGLVE